MKNSKGIDVWRTTMVGGMSRKVVMVMSFFFMTGCGTFIGRVIGPGVGSINTSKPKRTIYPGVVFDYGCMRSIFNGDDSAYLIGFVVLDVPFSICADTILLPLDIYYFSTK